jgi:hypothetical protein
VLALALLGSAVGCRSLPSQAVVVPAAARLYHQGEPRLAFVYHPYGPSLKRELAAPHPDYQGWTDMRMRLDTQRMRRAGADLALVVLDPTELLAQPERQERYQRFLAFAAQAGLPVVWYLPPGSGAHLGRLTDWLLALSLERSPAYRQVEGRPVVASADAVTWAHPGIGVEVWAWEPHPAWAELPPLAGAQCALARLAVLVEAGRYSSAEGRWVLPRREGRPLAEAVSAARAIGPAWVVVASWNDFATGSFVEPNSLDQEQVLERLEQAWRKGRGTP